MSAADLKIEFPTDALAAFCRKWQIVELSLFGSVLRDDFGPESDVDVLATFADGASASLWDWGAMMDELSSIFGRRIDLLEKQALKNPLRRKHIMANHRVVYAT